MRSHFSFSFLLPPFITAFHHHHHHHHHHYHYYRYIPSILLLYYLLAPTLYLFNTLVATTTTTTTTPAFDWYNADTFDALVLVVVLVPLAVYGAIIPIPIKHYVHASPENNTGEE